MSDLARVEWHPISLEDPTTWPPASGHYIVSEELTDESILDVHMDFFSSTDLSCGDHWHFAGDDVWVKAWAEMPVCYGQEGESSTGVEWHRFDLADRETWPEEGEVYFVTRKWYGEAPYVRISVFFGHPEEGGSTWDCADDSVLAWAKLPEAYDPEKEAGNV